ncbi:MAG: DNA alkylation repair protein [Candidatus Roizmanbacteria bacterium]|nr:DNA alkylation repair protein [Candidatus Roizmanbacteria bacterium]
MINIVLKELKKYASAKRKTSNELFFKTGKGQYGEGDVFIGVSNPDARSVVKKFESLPFEDIKDTLASEIHEARFVGVLILVTQYEKAKDEAIQLQIAQFYLQNMERVNNWDLVDASAHKIIGQAILDGMIDEKLLDTLAKSNIMWERRVAIIATLAFIKESHYDVTLRITKKLLSDKEDLMHKAVGWMLREVWKKDSVLCEEFLLAHYSRLPRTTLRYAIERMEEGKRKKFLMMKNES